ncbi:MAG: hypothetical protein EON88_25815 [Brevundimonas sp.]|nr:MAG: hypothetical protein EON88_25815 [Brevundimonas sp.]
MIRAISLAALLAVLPVSTAFAADEPDSAAEAAFEAQAAAFEARMEAVERQADAIQADDSLSEEEQGARISDLMAAHQGEITAFASAAAAFAADATAAAMADVDVATIVAEAMDSPEVQQAIAGGVGIAANSAWTHPDADQMVTYQLMAQHALDEAGMAADDAEAADPH